MEVSVTQAEGLQRRMKVAVPADVIEDRVKTRLKSLARSVKLDGFRPGKVPMGVVEKRFGEQVRHEVSQDVIQQTFRDAIAQEKLRPAGQPQIELAAVEKGLEFTATFEVYPEFDVNVPSGASVERPVCNVADADIDTVIDRIRNQNKEWSPVDRAAQNGDTVNVDFVGTVDGEKFPGGEAQNYDLEIGAKRLVGDFEQQLEGAKAGDTRGVDVTFPESYPAQDLAGKAAHFEVKINSVSEPRLPEVNEDFVKRFGIVDGSVEAFRQQVKENIEREIQQAISSKVKNQVIEILLGAVEVDLPQTLVQNEIAARMQRMQQQLGASGVDLGKLNLEPATFEGAAKRSVSLGLIVAEILKKNGIKITSQELRAAVEQQAATYEDPQQVVQWYFSNQQRLAELEALLLEDKAVAWVVERIEVKDVPTTVTELLDSSANAA